MNCAHIGLPATAFLLVAGLVAAEPRLPLRDGWTLQSSVGGSVYPATVPSTVLGTLIRNKVYPDPYIGMNLRSIPGTSYKVSTNFSNSAMPEDSPFRRSWWFRNEFQAPDGYRGKTVWLHFDGINFRANVWLNGHQIASSDKMAGAWRLFEYDVTRVIKPGGKNLLAVEVFPPQPNDLAITFVDWNPLPARQRHGHLARRVPHRERPSRDPLPAGDHAPRFRRGRSHRHSRAGKRARHPC